MSLTNDVRLMGFLAATPPIRQTKQGVDFISFSLYTREPLITAKSDQSCLNTAGTITQAHRCLLFGERAGQFHQTAEKGRHLIVCGRLQTQRKGEGKEARYYTSVIVDGFYFSPRQSVAAIRDCLREMVEDNHIKTKEDLNQMAIFEGHEI